MLLFCPRLMPEHPAVILGWFSGFDSQGGKHWRSALREIERWGESYDLVDVELDPILWSPIPQADPRNAGYPRPPFSRI